MANAVFDSTPSPEPVREITEPLRRLRRRVAVWFLVDGFSRLLAAAVLLIGFDLLVDWAFEMDRPQRIVMIGLVLVCLAVVFAFRVIRPFWGRRLSDDALCLQVERQNAGLRERVITALQFSRQREFERAGVSRAMVDATIRDGVRAADGVPFDDVLRRDRFIGNTLLLLGSLAALIGIGLGAKFWEPLQIWYQRNVLLLEDVDWPQDTVFHVDGVRDGVLTVPRGDDWLFVARVDPDSNVFPDAATLEFRKDGERRTVVMKPSQDKQAASGEAKAHGSQPLAFEHKLLRVVEPFEFRIVCSSGRTKWIPVRLVDRPDVKSLDLTAIEPDYAGGKRVELPAGRGPYYVLGGSRVAISGTATEPLTAAEVILPNAVIPLHVDGRSFSGEIPPQHVVEETYKVRLVDNVAIRFPKTTKTRRLESKPHTRFALKIRPDHAPKLTLRLKGIGGMVVPEARIPCEVLVEDDYAVTAVRRRHKWRLRDETEFTQGGDPLDDANRELANEEKQPWKSFVVNHLIDLKPLKIPIGARFSFQFEANDNDVVARPETGKVGKTLLMTIRVVSEDELRADLLRREKEQQQEFERLVDEQDKVYTELVATLTRIRGNNDVPAQDRNRLRELQKQQHTLGKNLDAIAAKLADILLEFRNNRIVDVEQELENREKFIIGPMQNLARKTVPETVDLLTQARRTGTPPAERDIALKAAQEKQESIKDEMANILKRMNRTARFQEVVNLTYRVLKAQQAVLGLTDRQIKELLKKSLKSLPPKTKK